MAMAIRALVLIGIKSHLFPATLLLMQTLISLCEISIQTAISHSMEPATSPSLSSFLGILIILRCNPRSSNNNFTHSLAIPWNRAALLINNLKLNKGYGPARSQNKFII